MLVVVVFFPERTRIKENAVIVTKSGLVELFAEVKPCSPSGWRSRYSWNELFELANSHPAVDALSIHTSPRWEGSFELITQARKHTSKPILAKGIHAHDDDINRALDAGATMALAVGRIPWGFPHDCLIVEPLSLGKLAQIPLDYKTQWNARDLVGLFRKLAGLPTRKESRPSFTEARAVRQHGWICQASHLKTKEDIQTGANAVLVGTNLPEFLASL